MKKSVKCIKSITTDDGKTAFQAGKTYNCMTNRSDDCRLLVNEQGNDYFIPEQYMCENFTTVEVNKVKKSEYEKLKRIEDEIRHWNHQIDGDTDDIIKSLYDDKINDPEFLEIFDEVLKYDKIRIAMIDVLVGNYSGNDLRYDIVGLLKPLLVEKIVEKINALQNQLNEMLE